MLNALELNNKLPIQAQSRMGRPVKVFTQTDWEHIEKLCSLMCTAEEIAGFLDVSVDTLSRRIKESYDITCAEYLTEKKIGAQIALRRVQWQSAMGGNVAMQIFLGKQYLGQSNRMDLTIDQGVRPDVRGAWRELEAIKE